MLRYATVQLDDLGLPICQSGQFATVFKVDSDGETWAVRCFLLNIEDRVDRYSRISKYLKETNGACFVDFDFIERGILVNSAWFPILKMRYVKGISLGEYVRKNRSNPEGLRWLLDRFQETMIYLKANDIAHGDLQLDNVIISDSQIKLVDYDGIYVPSLASWKSCELGHRNFQHHQRSINDFGVSIDDFSAWIIQSAIETLIEAPPIELLIEDKLVVSAADFIAPTTSVVLQQLECAGGAAAIFSRRVFSMVTSNLSNVPEFPGGIFLLSPNKYDPLTVPGLLESNHLSETTTDGRKNVGFFGLATEEHLISSRSANDILRDIDRFTVREGDFTQLVPEGDYVISKIVDQSFILRFSMGSDRELFAEILSNSDKTGCSIKIVFRERSKTLSLGLILFISAFGFCLALASHNLIVSLVSLFLPYVSIALSRVRYKVGERKENELTALVKDIANGRKPRKHSAS